MGTDADLPRRGFVKFCGAAVAAVGADPSRLARAGNAVKLYEAVTLVDRDGAILRPETLERGRSYVFHYPYVTTPCFLIDLGRPTPGGIRMVTEDGRPYVWPGGVGPSRSIVAFAAICAHKMSHPARSVSFINYRHETVHFKDRDERPSERAGVIYCCSERSVYDPADGARVLGGPAKQPLATILLSSDDATGGMRALGTTGGEMYRDFFDSFGFRIALENGTSDIERRSSGMARVVTIEEYSRTRMEC